MSCHYIFIWEIKEKISGVKNQDMMWEKQMPKFRKKPVIIEAMQFATTEAVLEPSYLDKFETWMREKDPQQRYHYSGNQLLIPTLEGILAANVGDWIICGVKGELYPCKPDIFEAIYELVDEITEKL
jgi:hypothetical protein